MAWLPLTRPRWVEFHLAFFRSPEADVIRLNANWLLERLYRPDAKIGCIYNSCLGKELGLDNEAINWGDLHADCELVGGRWRITLEEARDAPNLCAYVRDWMGRWGWPCEVVAEW